MKNDLEVIAKDGYSLGMGMTRLDDLAALSLRSALRSYFSTYSSVRYLLPLLTGAQTRGTSDVLHGIDYCTHAFATIVHCQHFAELLCKQILRRAHPLLADEGSKRAVILHKLLTGEALVEEDEAAIKSLEFSESFERLQDLVRAGRIHDADAAVLCSARPTLNVLNRLRNRAWHRGTFVLRYAALDELMGSFVLPFVQSVLALPEHQTMAQVAWHRPLACGLDPATEIIRTMNGATPDF